MGPEPLAVPSEPIRGSAERAGQDIRSGDRVGFVLKVEGFERRLKLEGLTVYMRPVDSQIHKIVPIHDIVCVYPPSSLFRAKTVALGGISYCLGRGYSRIVLEEQHAY